MVTDALSAQIDVFIFSAIDSDRVHSNASETCSGLPTSNGLLYHKQKKISFFCEKSKVNYEQILFIDLDLYECVINSSLTSSNVSKLHNSFDFRGNKFSFIQTGSLSHTNNCVSISKSAECVFRRLHGANDSHGCWCYESWCDCVWKVWGRIYLLNVVIENFILLN